MMKQVRFLILAGFLLLGSSALMAQTLKATLTGGQEVTAEGSIITAANGDATFNIIGTADRAGPIRVEFTVRLRQFGTDVNEMHIHLGEPGISGPIILNLYNRQRHGAISGVSTLDGGTFTGIALEGDATPRINDALRQRGIRNFADIRRAMRNGLTYINVHTTSVPGGEIRGQVYLAVELP